MSFETTLPAIGEAAEAATVYEAALRYADLGLSVIPTRGKVPAVPSWRDRQTRRATRTTIQYWHDQGLLTNVGIVCGAVSGNLVVIDLDGEAAFGLFAGRFPALLDTYTVRSGSGHGYHLYYRAESLPTNNRVTGIPAGNIELRANGHYVVAPPSIHPKTGQRYVIARSLDIMQVFAMHEVVWWIKRLIADKHGGTLPAPRTPAATPRQQASDGEIKNPVGYAINATRSECNQVRYAPVNERNITLNRAAFRLGQLVAKGWLMRSYVESELTAAAAGLAADDGDLSVTRTIKSGLDAGIDEPRQV